MLIGRVCDRRMLCPKGAMLCWSRIVVSHSVCRGVVFRRIIGDFGCSFSTFCKHPEEVCEMEVPEEYMEDAIDCGQNGYDVRVPDYQEMLNSIDQDPVQVGYQDTEKKVEMDLVAKTPHLSESKSDWWLDAGGGMSPEVEEDEDSNHEGDDGHSVPQKEDEE
mgnify:CR=1 FL=1